MLHDSDDMDKVVLDFDAEMKGRQNTMLTRLDMQRKVKLLKGI